MENKAILNKVDHTELKQISTWSDIKKICDQGLQYEVASVCIPPSYVKEASDYLNGKLKVCTVIGFPNGYNTTACKCFETEDAITNGADEIDMVINIGWLKDGKYDLILDEINAIKEVCKGRILKVIIETCLLTEEEKITMCKIISKSNADFIKTSTGFSVAGATLEDIRLFSANVSNDKKIKAAGGIASLEDASKFIELGASRLGTSRIVKIIENDNSTLSDDY